MSLRSPLGVVRGLGSAKSGVGHFWTVRLLAVALIPLGLWFVVSVIGQAGADYASFRHWLATPCNAALMLLTVLGAIWHGALGVQVVIEDYVHCPAAKLASLVASRLLAFLLAALVLVSIVKIAVGG
jgi:succinate dehydrogenase / fumarate reductase, membrane anchor subunit